MKEIRTSKVFHLLLLALALVATCSKGVTLPGIVEHAKPIPPVLYVTIAFAIRTMMGTKFIFIEQHLAAAVIVETLRLGSQRDAATPTDPLSRL